VKFSWVTLTFLAASCASGGSAMAMSHYEDVMIGSSAEQVEALVGKPNTVRKQPGGVVEYEYVERIKIGARNIEERHYIIRLKDGKVVSKQQKDRDTPDYVIPGVQGDSYDMQTTQNIDE